MDRRQTWCWTWRSRSRTFLVNGQPVGLQPQICLSECARRQSLAFGITEATRYVQSPAVRRGLWQAANAELPPKGRSGRRTRRGRSWSSDLPYFPFLPELDRP